MNNKEIEYLFYIANMDLSAYQYKVLLLLMEKPYNQAALASTLKTKRQNIHKCVKELEELGLIEIDRQEGRNKYYRAVTAPEKLNVTIPGQIKINFKEGRE